MVVTIQSTHNTGFTLGYQLNTVDYPEIRHETLADDCIAVHLDSLVTIVSSWHLVVPAENRLKARWLHQQEKSQKTSSS